MPTQPVSKAARSPVDNRAQTNAQLQLKQGIHTSTRQQAAIQRRLTIGTSDGKRIVFRDMPRKPGPADGNAYKLKEHIKHYTGDVARVYSYLRRQSRGGRYEYADTSSAITNAILRLKELRQAQKEKKHLPSVPMSPLHDDQTAMISYLHNEGRKAEHMRDGAEWNELKINGQLGERGHQNLLSASSIPFEDANNFLTYNAPGLDTFSDEADRCFGQSKMHMAEGMAVADIARQYFTHLDAAEKYATVFLKRVVIDTPNGKKARQSIAKLATDWNNATLLELDEHLSDKSNIVSKSELNDHFDMSTNADGDMEYPAIVSLVADAMHFPVPADVYDYIKANHPTKLAQFTRLPHDLYWYRKVKASMPYKYQNPPKTEEDKDGTYTE